MFAIQHSVMARPAFKEVFARVVPAPAERSTYVLASSLALMLLFWKWQPLGGEVWTVQSNAGRARFYGGFAFGWALLLYTTNPAGGRAGITGRDADRFNFKVPTIRNVELTYPYFHDGAAATLTEAVEVMGRVQLDQPSFRLPLLPPSSDRTPRPNPFK